MPREQSRCTPARSMRIFGLDYVYPDYSIGKIDDNKWRKQRRPLLGHEGDDDTKWCPKLHYTARSRTDGHGRNMIPTHAAQRSLTLLA